MSPVQRRADPRNGSGLFALVALALAVALVSVAAAIWWRPALYATGLWVDGGSPTVSPPLFDDPSSPASQQGKGGVIGPATPAPSSTPLDGKALTTALAAVPAEDVGTTAGMVLDAASGETLWQSRSTQNLVPASTLKILTCAAALDVLGPHKRFSTSVVQASPERIILVGGGDPFLASKHAKGHSEPQTSAELAARTAAALKKQDVTTVTLGYDDKLFTGPAWHPSWPEGYHDQVTTVSSLWIDKGRPSQKEEPSRTPAVAAATVFAAQLKAQGITVKGKPASAAANAHARPLASVQSLPLSSIVQEVLVHSDNAAAEVLLRHVGLATGHGASFAGGAKGVQERALALAPGSPEPKIADGSGLSRSNALSAQLLAGVLHKAATTPKLAPLLEGMPVAGVSGTLTMRFHTPESEAGRGVVNAKTGTLSKVSTLAGFTRTRSGNPVVFALLANNPTQEWNVRSWLDQMSTTIATCDC
ncbi:D-alanyl-D-alanine carboxypeptidase/D-alanyl-D-alanine endopeptidase [Luteococcus sp. OSA5]|uniref:D-alanyl-D-alanine carboxypeptidase/D-alanyl-D-alanine endopeptidase n=1 Tax=Luteococcus sp. OSA5 TaxID=3401630 RepID=UPI003B436CC0